MAHHRHHGSMAAFTLVPVEMHHRHLILQINELNPQTESVVLRLMERSGLVLDMYRESNPFHDLDTSGIVTGYMLYDGCGQF